MNERKWGNGVKPGPTGLEVDTSIFGIIFKKFEIRVRKREYIDLKKNGFIFRIHLEHIYKENLLTKKKTRNFFMINQELIQNSDIKLLNDIDLVITKTKTGTEFIENIKNKFNFNFSIYYLGFTSFSKKSGKLNYSSYLHPAGASWMKNTDIVINTWLKNPSFPHITILCREECNDTFKKTINKYKKLCKNSKCKNITLHTKKIPYEELKKLQTESGVHIVSSFTEGWGHYLHEAKSAGVVCLYSDFPPMNEFFNEHTGISVGGDKKFVKLLRGAYGSYGLKITVDSLEKAVKKSMEMSTEQKKEMGKAAQDSFYNDRKEFLERAEILNKKLVDITLIEKE
jgi:hypothetical protein